MYRIVEKWLDEVLHQQIPEEVIAFSFNLYEDGNNKWSMELVGTDSYNADDEDWRCGEVTDFQTRNNPLAWTKDTNWAIILEDVMNAIKEYLAYGKFADVLKAKEAVGIGFIDGDVETIYPM